MYSGATATSANAPRKQNAATRSPVSRRMPPTSLPGTNGSSGLNWYSPRVCRTSGNETPAACTSTTTPRPGVSMCVGSGSGTSTSSSARSGPSRFTIWTARTARDPMSARRCLLPARACEDATTDPECAAADVQAVGVLRQRDVPELAEEVEVAARGAPQLSDHVRTEGGD